jgi:hypothetical protein
MWNTRESSPRPNIIDLTDAMEVDEIPAGPKDLIGVIDVAIHAEDPAEVEPPPTLLHSREQEELSGFQLLDPLECIMVPWTKVSMCETSLYVPAAFGDLIQRKQIF